MLGDPRSRSKVWEAPCGEPRRQRQTVRPSAPQSELQPGLVERIVVVRYRMYLESRSLAAKTINHLF